LTSQRDREELFQLATSSLSRGGKEVLVSRLATIVGLLSAIVTLADYLAARSFLSEWLHQQIRHGNDGWQISPTLNFLLMAVVVGLVWLLTESPADDPVARKRLVRLRTNLVVLLLGTWFFFGPSIGAIDKAPPTHAAASAPPSDIGNRRNLVEAAPASQLPKVGAPAAGPTLSHGHTSQFTWQQGGRPAPTVAWRPGDGLRAMARLLEDVASPPGT
jgi:hypothetical protein